MADDLVLRPENHRATIAVLDVKLDNLRADVRDIKTTLKEHCRSEEIWREKMDHRMNAVETEQARQKERLSIWAAGQALWAGIAAAIAGFFGSRQ